MPASEIAALTDKFNEAHAALQSALAGITDASVKKSPGGEEWSVGQILSHVEEMQRQWIDKAVLMTRQDNPFAGRTEAEQARRLSYVAQHAGDSLAQHKKALEDGKAHVLKALAGLKPSDLDKKGTRADGAAVTVREMVSRTICDHILEHARQIQETRKKMGG